jgi:hypothetical protein
MVQSIEKQSRKARIFPKQQQVLTHLGENIRLAITRRKLSINIVAQRTGINPKTVQAIAKGSPSVSIGHYVVVLSAIGLLDDLANVAQDDELGRKLQDINMKRGKKS